MKKYLISLATALLTLAFTACEDVPAPYGINDGTVVTPPTEEGVIIDAPLSSSLDGFTAINTVGSYSFAIDGSYGYVKVTSYVDQTNNKAESWLVSQPFSLKDVASAHVTFDYVLRYANAGELKTNYAVRFSKDYAGDPATCTWVNANFTPVTVDDWKTWTTADVNVPAEFLGQENLVVALYYKAEAKAATWELKNFKLSEGEAEGGNDNPGGEEAQPVGDGTLENPFNSVAANQYAASLENGAESDKDVYIKGKIVSIKENYGTLYGNASFYISDDGKANNQFYVFCALYLNNVKYTEGDLLNVGDEVVVCGKVTNYMGNTPETAANKAYLYSVIKGEGGGDNPGGEDPGTNPGGNLDPITSNSLTVETSSFGVENGTAVPTQTLSDGTTLSFDGGGNTNVPKYYNTGNALRMYPKNSMTVESKDKQIVAIRLVCDNYQGTIYNASGDVSAEPGSVDTADEVITITDVNSLKTVLTNVSTTTGAPSQLRIKTIIIYYAE